MPPKSKYWEYFEKIDNSQARCRSCSKILKTCGNTTNLRLHIEKMHPILLKKRQNDAETDEPGSKKLRAGNESPTTEEKQMQPQPSTSFATSAPSSSYIGSEIESESVKSDTSGTSATASTSRNVSKIKSSFQPTLTSTFRNIHEYTETGAKGVRLSAAILYMICKDSQPFQIVENEGFLELMKVAAPLYKVPSRFTFKKMLENKFEVTQNYFKNKLKTVNSCTLTTDVWTETMQTRSFLGVTVHFFDNDKLESATLGVYELSEHHTGEYISQMLLKTTEEWGINNSKVLAVVTDAGANMIKAVDLAFGKKSHIPCFAHMLNLVAQKSLEKTQNLPQLISAIKKIVTWFKHSVIASDELRKEASLKLIQEVSTRWNSTFYMIERFLELRAAINKILICHATAPAMITAKDIEDLKEITEILRPIELATREICGQKYVTSSKVIPLTRMLSLKISGLKPKTAVGINLQENIMNEIKKRLLPAESINILAVSTLLDPRFKNIHFQDAVACSRAIRIIKDLMLIQETDKSEQIDVTKETYSKADKDEFNLWNEHYKIVEEKQTLPHQSEVGDMPSEFSFYLKSPLSDLKQEPLEIWSHGIGSSFPKMKPVAIKYLSCIATSTPSERLFSKAGITLTQQRNRLKGQLLSKLLFMQSVDKKFWDL